MPCLVLLTYKLICVDTELVDLLGRVWSDSILVLDLVVRRVLVLMVLNSLGVGPTQIQSVDADHSACSDQDGALDVSLVDLLFEVLRVDLLLSGGLEARVRTRLLVKQDRLVVLLDRNARVVVLKAVVEVHLVLDVLLVDLVGEVLVQVVQLTTVLAEPSHQVADFGCSVRYNASLVNLGSNGGVAFDDN